MLGGMFAGHDQCAGDIVEKNGKKVKLFYGMSSDTAMKKHAGGVADYRYHSLSSIICKATSWNSGFVNMVIGSQQKCSPLQCAPHGAVAGPECSGMDSNAFCWMQNLNLVDAQVQDAGYHLSGPARHRSRLLAGPPFCCWLFLSLRSLSLGMVQVPSLKQDEFRKWAFSVPEPVFRNKLPLKFEWPWLHRLSIQL